MWNTFVHAKLYSNNKKIIENISWMGIANLDEKHYSPMLVNEFYSGLLLRSTELRTLLGLILRFNTLLLMDMRG